MHQISEKVYCDDFLSSCEIAHKILPNPYHDYPFLVIEDFFSKQMCETFVHEILTSCIPEDAKIKTGLQSHSLNTSIRKTSLYELTPSLHEDYETQLLHFKERIERFFSHALTHASAPQVLGYEKGEFYARHADDSSEIVKEGKTIGFKCVAPHRKITTLLFLNTGGEAFEGGELIFNYLYDAEKNMISLTPKAGMMVVFASNPYFSHEVKPVTKGVRMTIAQWHNAI